MKQARVAGAMLAVALAACGGSDGGGGSGPDQAAAVVLARVGGDLQAGPVGTALPVALAVQVSDSTGRALVGRTVRWTVTSGDGSVAAATSESGAAGRASAGFQFGPAAGSVQVEAQALEGAAASGAPTVFALTGLDAGAVVELHAEPISASYGIHDQFVRDGLAFVCAWNNGLQIWDVGDGRKGGSPSHPMLVSSIVPTPGPSGLSGAIHNAWWFHNGVTGEKRYVFLGQEGPGSVGSASRGDIFVIDVSDLARPRQVAAFGLAGAGTHNFWVDETAQVLYAAYYNGGVVALDVSGTLGGDLSSRLIANVKPGGLEQTYVWGVQLHQGSLYAIDMESGLWRLAPASGALATQGGGFNVPERWSSDLWLHGDYAYTGTWGGVSRGGNVGDALKIWSLANLAAPIDSVILPDVGTVSDVEVSADGRALLLTAERGNRQGVYIYSLGDPAHPARRGYLSVPSGLHTGTFADIGGRRYVFAARNPSQPALMSFDVTQSAQ